MKFSLTEWVSTVTEIEPCVTTRPRSGLWGRLRGSLTQFKLDLRVTLPGQDEMSGWASLRARLFFLLKRHGWKLITAVVVYYLVRDTLLYIVLPYFFARQIFG